MSGKICECDKSEAWIDGKNDGLADTFLHKSYFITVALQPLDTLNKYTKCPGTLKETWYNTRKVRDGHVSRTWLGYC